MSAKIQRKIDSHELLTIPEAAAFVGIGHNRCRGMVAKKALPSLRIGQRTYVPRKALTAWIEANTEGAQPCI